MSIFLDILNFCEERVFIHFYIPQPLTVTPARNPINVNEPIDEKISVKKVRIKSKS